MVRTIILWDCDGKIEATLFASNHHAFELETVNDQMGMIAVKVTTSESFDEQRHYLVRQLTKNGSTENQLIFGTMPGWAGGELLAPRCILASGADCTLLLKKFPAQSISDKETRRLNGVSNDSRKNHDEEDCMGI